MNSRILVAGIGNIFLGDDGFGVEVARRLSERNLPEWVEVRDFGIRGMDLAYALLEEREAVIFVDAMPRGKEPGTLTILEPETHEGETTPDTHAMTPDKVLALAKILGAPETKTIVLGCEPKNIAEEDEMTMELTDPVKRAVEEAAKEVEKLIEEIHTNGTKSEIRNHERSEQKRR